MNPIINLKRRDFLVKTTSIFGGIGIGVSSIPFIMSWTPSEKTKSLGAPIDIDLKKINKGQKITVTWRGQPIFIINRDDDMINNLNKVENNLKDPNSNESTQPVITKNMYRSINKDFLVVTGICTHLGCVPLYKPKIGQLDSTWLGGFFCPCHGSKFDLSGRVFKGVPAPFNLPIPPYKYINENIIRIGEN